MVYLCTIGIITAQDYPKLLVNEINVGTTGSYIELVVVGTLGRPQTPSEFQDWTLDNNSIELSNDNGTLRFGSCFTNIPTGSIILIYDNQSVHPRINTARDGFPNTAGVYQIPFSDNCLIKCSVGSEFGCDAISGTLNNWDQVMNIDADQDVIQVRNQRNHLEHAISWADETFVDQFNSRTKNIVEFDVTGPTVNIGLRGGGGLGAGTGGGTTPCDLADLPVGVIDVGSPGDPNDPFNGGMIGGFDKSKLPLNISCSTNYDPGTNEHEVVVEVIAGPEPFSYRFSNDWTSFSDDFTGTTLALGNVTTGTQNITIIDADGCEKTCSVEVVKKSNESVCLGACEMIGVEDEGYCYKWTEADGITDLNSSKTEVCPTESTTYFLSVIDNGDIKEVIEFEIEITRLDVEIVPDDPFICDEPFYLLENHRPRMDSDSYVWSDGSTGKNLYITEPGTYSLTLTDETGCSGEDQVIVQE